ncbi:MAG: hypothetical protein DRO15_07560 [Thermoprotei archaeon]|nr:MAG: hypothetical protein DRO15_07560 [Thermoprotei archaeon]
MKKAIISRAIGDYVTVEMDATYAPDFLEEIRNFLKRGGEDVADTIRMIKNFDVFHDFMTRKFKEYLVPKKELSDLIRGNVIIDKIKLIKDSNRRRVLIMFDRSVKEYEIIKVLSELGFEIQKR